MGEALRPPTGPIVPPDLGSRGLEFMLISFRLHRDFTRCRQDGGTMKTKDYLIVALAPLAVLLIPLVCNHTVDGWNWTWHDFALMWVILTVTTLLYRLLVTRQPGNLAFRLGSGLGVAGGFLLTWANLAVQVIGDDNPGNLLYFLVILGGFIGVALSRFDAARLARVAFAMAAAIFLIPLVAVLAWPADFSPGFAKVVVLNFGFVAMFAGAGLFFLRAGKQSIAA
jgi:hypothetical protein